MIIQRRIYNWRCRYIIFDFSCNKIIPGSVQEALFPFYSRLMPRSAEPPPPPGRGHGRSNRVASFSVFATPHQVTGPSSLKSSSIKQASMSGRMFCPSAALLRSLRPSPYLQRCSRHCPIGRRRSFHAPSKLLEEQKSFRSQLYESTARRLQRQREAEARFADRTPPTKLAVTAAFTFCTNPNAVRLAKTDFGKQWWYHVRYLTGLGP